MSTTMTSQHRRSTPPVQDHYSLRQSRLHPHPGPALVYQQDLLDGSSFVPSGPTTTFNSPRPGQAMIDSFEMHNPTGFANAHMSPPYQADSLYQSPVQAYSYPHPGMYGRISPLQDVELPTRGPQNPRRLAPNSYPRTPSPPKRKRPPKKDSAKRSKLERPLSELTAHLTHIPIKDTEAWVKRPTEQRLKEVGGDGFIKRPSNSFILYRSAYADRCREYEKSNNHQDISSMAGASWAIESAPVRKQYEDWAKLERENHQAAFPGYKFQPQTQEAKAKKRKERYDEESLEESDLDDPTYPGRGATPGSSRSTRTKKLRRDLRESSHTPSLKSEGDWGSPDPYSGNLYNASYHHGMDAGQSLARGYPRGQNGIYYHATSQPNLRFSNIGHVEDIVYQPNDEAYGIYGSHMPRGLPGMTQEELIGDAELDNGHLTFTAPVLDPELLAFNQGLSEQADPSIDFQADNFLDEGPHAFEVDVGSSDDLAKWDHFDSDPVV